jgi:hypothetical protein
MKPFYIGYQPKANPNIPITSNTSMENDNSLNSFNQKQKLMKMAPPPSIVTNPQNQPNNPNFYAMNFQNMMRQQTNHQKNSDPIEVFHKRLQMLNSQKEKDDDGNNSARRLMFMQQNMNNNNNESNSMPFLNLDKEQLMKLYRKNLNDQALLMHIAGKKNSKNCKDKQKHTKSSKKNNNQNSVNNNNDNNINNINNINNNNNNNNNNNINNIHNINNNNNNNNINNNNNVINNNVSNNNHNNPKFILPNFNPSFTNEKSNEKIMTINNSNHEQKIGALTKEERKLKIEKYLTKKRIRTWNRKTTYQCRKQVADKRLRLKGRFTKKPNKEFYSSEM